MVRLPASGGGSLCREGTSVAVTLRISAPGGIVTSSFESDPRLAHLVGPGAPFEVETRLIDGVPVRSFVRGPTTLVDVFRMGAARSDLVHVVYGHERLTFAEVRRQALSAARWLREQVGVRPGDRVAIAMSNLPEFIVSFWAGVVVGAIVVPLNAWWTGPELHYALENAGASVVFADDRRVARIASTGSSAGRVTVVGVRSTGPATSGDTAFADVIATAPLEDADLARMSADDPVTILYTSGTTGRPKGAQISHRSTITNILNMGFSAVRESLISGRAPARSGQPATISGSPLFHIGGIASIVGAPMSGLKIVLMDKWNVHDAVRLATEEHVTGFGGVPAIARQSLEHPAAAGLRGQVQTFSMGGAAVPPELPRLALEVFGESVQLLNGYGLTETTSGVVTNLGVEYAAHPDSVGRPNLTAELRVESPEGAVLPVGEVGELCFRTSQNAGGYWNDPEGTRRAFVDGWFHTGDVGYVDEDGYVYVVDRLKDVVIRGGENVYCAEVEAVLFEHPDVSEVAIIGLPDDVMGERVCAVVVPRPGRSPGLAEIRAFAAARLAAFKCPEALYLAQDVPRTATSKVAKKQLRDVVAADQDAIERLSN